ncbi:MAG TPA: GNAT family N-acetyltransferase [Acidobacteriaceae bacterium]|nr:GNAT family N-acetyltransferase [Acidobacteriaceae bacterium]
MSETLLDNPMWSALTTDHTKFAMGGALARRYRDEIGPLSGMVGQSDAAYEELRSLAGPGGMLGLFFLEEPRPPAGWTLVRGGRLNQMIAREPRLTRIEPPAGATLRALTAESAPAMVELAELTEPGPFRLRSMELGDFFGVFHGDRLMAMAGMRMQVPGATEVSAVCTHPEARGRGYARMLMSRVMERIVAAGRTPFLHTLAENSGAISIYESLGFSLRQSFALAVVRRDD